MDTGKSLLGILGGVAIGAALGILFAPDKGSKTRQRISSKKEEFTDEVSERFNSMIQSITDHFESLKKEMANKSSNGTASPKDASIKDAAAK